MQNMGYNNIDNKSKATKYIQYFITVDGLKCSNIPIYETTDHTILGS